MNAVLLMNMDWKVVFFMMLELKLHVWFGIKQLLCSRIQFEMALSNQARKLWSQFIKARTAKESSWSSKKFEATANCVWENLILQKNTTKACFVLTNKIAKQNKSFAEAKFIKDCMIDAVSVVCPEVKSKVEAISLSQRTIVRRIVAIAVNIQEQLLTASGSC